MQVTLRSAAALAFFVLSFCDMDNWCIETRAMTAAVVSSDTVSATDSIYAASPVHSSGVAVEAKHQGTRAADPLVTSKSSPLTKKAEALRRRRITTAASVGAVLTAVLGLLVAVAKLQQCRRKLVTDTNGTTEGHTGRRLADGGDDEDDCVEESNNATEAMLRLARGADELSSLAGSLSTEAMLRASRLSTEPDEQQGAPNAAAPNAAALASAALASLTKAIAKLQTATDLILQEGRLRRRGPLLLSRDPLAPRAEGLRRMAKGLPLPPVTSVPPSAIRAPLAAGLMQMAKSGSGSRSLLLMQKAMDLPLPPSRPSSPSPPSDPEDDATQTAPDSGEPAKDFQSHESQEEQ